LVISDPKSERARRTVPLSPAIVAMLHKHKASQAAERLRAANQWQDSGLVFTTELGAPVDSRNFLRVMEAAAKAAGVESDDVHALRHSAAVRWLESGVHIKAVADLLGHSSIAITGDIYGQTSDNTARSAVEHLSGRSDYETAVRGETRAGCCIRCCTYPRRVLDLGGSVTRR
jgi:site-specific recombinase XerD